MTKAIIRLFIILFLANISRVRAQLTLDQSASVDTSFSAQNFTFQFDINNTSGSALNNISFYCFLPAGISFADEPANLSSGLTFGATTITDSNEASFTITNVPTGASTFEIQIKPRASNTVLNLLKSASYLFDLPPAIGSDTIFSDDPALPGANDSTEVYVAPVFEVCGDGIDNDEDGDIDEACATFPCNGKLYQTIHLNDTTTLYEIILEPLSFEEIGELYTSGLTGSANSTGYNPDDNLLYMVKNTELWRVDANADAEFIGTIQNLTADHNAGAFSTNGTYYVKSQADDEFGTIDLQTLNYTLISTDTKSFPDIAYNPQDGLMYGVTPQDELYTQDPSDGTLVKIGDLGINVGSVGAVYFDISGVIIAYGREQGVDVSGQQTLFSIDPATGAATVLGKGPTATGNDGASCPFGLDLIKIVSDSVATPGDTITYSFEFYNSSGETVNGITFGDTLFEGLTIVADPATFGGVITAGTGSGTSQILITDMDIPSGTSTMSFTAKVDESYLYHDCGADSLSNQAWLTNLPVVFGDLIASDDSATLAADDATLHRIDVVYSVTATEDFLAVEKNSDAVFDILTNDIFTQTTADTSSITFFRNPSNGSFVTANSQTTVTYTPNNNYVGHDTIGYSLCANECATECDSAFIVIRVLPEPLPCDGAIYLSQDDGSGGTDLMELDVSSTPFTSTMIGNYSPRFNATAYNPVDGFIYGITIAAPRHLILMGDQGETIDLGEIADSVGVTWPTTSSLWSGSFDVNGNYYTNNDSDTLYVVDIATVSITDAYRLGDATSTSFGDMAIPNDENMAYAFDTSLDRFVRIDLSTGALTHFGSSKPSFNQNGAAMFDAFNNLYIYGSDTVGGPDKNTLWKIDRSTGEMEYVGTGFAAGGGFDGTSCPYGIQMTKVADLDSYDLGDTIEYTLTITNQSAQLLTGITLSDTITFGGEIIEIPTNVLSGNVTNGVGDAKLTIEQMQIPVGESILTFKAKVPENFCSDTLLCNQALLLNIPSGFGDSVYSDDPSTALLEDSTSTTVVLPTVEKGSMSLLFDTLCIGDTLNFNVSGQNGTIEWQQSTDELTWALANAITNSNDTLAQFISANNLPAFDSVYFRMQSSSVCDTVYSDTIKISEHPQAYSGAITAQSTLCPGDELILTPDSTFGDELAWYVDYGSGMQLMAGQNDTTLQIIPDSIFDHDYQFVAAFSGSSCAIDSSNLAAVAFSDTSVTGTLDQTLVQYCSGELIDLQMSNAVGSFSWEESADQVSWSALGETDSSYQSSFTATGSVTDSMYYRVAIRSTCDTLYSDTALLIAHPVPVAGTADDQVLCPGESLTITFNGTEGDSIYWERSSGLNNFNLLAGASDTTFTETPPVPDTLYYRAIIKYSDGVCVADTTNEVQVSFSDTSVAGTLDQTLVQYCSGELIDLQMSNAVGSFSWEESADQVSWNALGETDSSYQSSFTATGSVTDSMYYRVAIRSTCDTLYSDTALLIAHPVPVAGTADDQVLCPGESLTITFNGTEGDSIYWERSSGLNNFNLLAGASDTTFTETPPVPDTLYYRAIIKYSDGVCATDTTNEVQVSFSDTSVAGTLDQTLVQYCSGELIDLQMSNAVGSFSWEESADQVSWSALGETDSSYQSSFTATGSVTDSMYYRVAIRSTCDTLYSDTALLIAHPVPVAGTADDQVLCPGESLTITFNGTEGDSIYWERSSGLNNFNLLAGASDTTFTETPPVPDTLYYRAIIKYSDGVCATDTTNEVQVSFSDTSVAGTLDQTLVQFCSGELIDLQMSNAVGSFSWEESADQGSWSALGETDSSYQSSFTATGSVTDSMYYRVAIRSTCDTLYSDTALLIAHPVPVAGTADDQVLCPGESLTITFNGTEGDSIYWERSSGLNNFNLLAGASDTTFTETPPVPDTLYYRAIIKYSDGVCATDTTNEVQVSFSDTSVAGTLDQTLVQYCSGELIDLQMSNAVGSFSWEESADQVSWDALGETDSSYQSSFTATGSVTDSMYYRVAIRSTCDTLYSDTALLIAHPVPVAGTADDQVLCPGESLTITFNGTEGDSIYWERSSGLNNFNLLAGASDTTFTETPPVPDTLYYRAIIKYSDGVCLADITNEVQVSFSDTSKVGTISATSQVCSGDTITAIANDFSSQIQWEQRLGTESEWSGLGNDTQQLVNMSHEEDESVLLYLRVSTQSTCDSKVSDSIQLSFDPKPEAGIVADGIACPEGTIIKSSGHRGNTITWEWSLDAQNWDNITNTGDSISRTFFRDRWFRATYSYDNSICPEVKSNEAFFQYMEEPALDDIISTDACTGTTSTYELEEVEGVINWYQKINDGSYELLNNDSVTIVIDNVDIGVDSYEQNYMVQVSACGKMVEDTLIYQVYDAPEATIDFESDCNERATQLSVSSNSDYIIVSWYESNDGISWINTEIADQVHVYTGVANRYFKVQVANPSLELCVDFSEIATVFLDCPLFIPNAISPNGDGANDTWRIEGLEAFDDPMIEVYNRYGLLLFENRGKYDPWDGTCNKEVLPNGTYYYKIKTLRDFGKMYTGSLIILK